MDPEEGTQLLAERQEAGYSWQCIYDEVV